MSIFIFRSVFVYIKLAALSDQRLSELRKFVALPNFSFFSEKVSSTNILRQ